MEQAANHELLIVSGMSGAGKSQVTEALEDMGYFCADNVPPSLISTFAALPGKSNGELGRIALVVDVRSRDTFSDMMDCLNSLTEAGTDYHLLFLDCADSALEIRYKETRRRHPLLGETLRSTAEAIAEERHMLEAVGQNADYIIDTTLLSVAQLKSQVREIFSAKGKNTSMQISCVSFGFKYGTPRDGDLVFDVRCLPNPFYIEKLKYMTGLEAPVADFVMSNEAAKVLLDKLFDLLEHLIPLYIQEGKSQLVIATGCTGGCHRSVVFAERIADYLAEKGLNVSRFHRDIYRVGHK